MPIWPLQRDCSAFYGDPGNDSKRWSLWEHANLITVPCPWPLFYEGHPTKGIRIHKKCADSLTRVLNNVWDALGKDISAVETLHYNRYSGSYNQRLMRGGTSRSMHGFGCAIDWDAENNAQHDPHGLFLPTSLIVVKFKEEGWIWGGEWSGSSVDKMHFQAARVHP
jgi:hypothetical protein